MTEPYLSVIIPTYNEAENFKKHRLVEVYAYLKKQKYSFELLLVNDGSSDGTARLLQDFAQSRSEVKVLDEPHRGKAGTVRIGMLTARGTYRLFTDFDQSTPISEIEKMMPLLKQNIDVVIGSREIHGAVRGKEPWYRHLMGKGFNFTVQLLAVRGIKDTQCGFKVLSGKAVADLFPRLKATVDPKKDAFTGAFDVELLFLAKLRGYSVVEVPVTWHHVKTIRVSPIKDSIRMFWQLWLIRWTYLLGAYAK